MNDTATTTRPTLSLKPGANPTITIPEREGAVVPKRNKASVGHAAGSTRKPQRLTPRNVHNEDEGFSGQFGGSQRQLKRPKR